MPVGGNQEPPRPRRWILHHLAGLRLRPPHHGIDQRPRPLPTAPPQGAGRVDPAQAYRLGERANLPGHVQPSDSRDQPRIAVEAEAILVVLAFCEDGQLELVASDALRFEAERNPHPVRKRHAFAFLGLAKSSVAADDQVVAAARGFEAHGIKPLDALHLASAVKAEADYFCTCDDRFLKRARTLPTAPMKVVSPLELITEIAR